MESRKLLICVVGPTAIGKTSMAIALAKAFDTEILSADSRQFYKEMKIGTAVPSEAELAAVPHHFIQHKSIEDAYTVGDFERDALKKLDELFATKKVVVMAGGSGLYVDAVVNGLDKFPEIPDAIREQLQQEIEKKGIAALQKELKEVDPQSYKTIDINNPQRLIRALEVFRATGTPYASFLNKKKAQRNFDTLYIGLTADREIVYSRINKRVDLMMNAGLLKEAQNLTIHRRLNALQTVGYKELFQYLDDELSLEEAINEIKKNTRRFAKRQGTWYRRNDAICWFDYKTPAKDIVSFIKQKKGL